MQHLFLTSSIGPPGIGESIRAKLGHKKPLKTTFISTPVEGESDQSDLYWVEEERVGLKKNGFDIFDYTITGKDFNQIKNDLSGIDVLYITGGNEHYFRQKCDQSGFEEFVHDFVATGKPYIGTSCGSIIAGRDISPTQKLNDLSLLTKPLDMKGFWLVDFTILPHWGLEDFRLGYIQESMDILYQEGRQLIALNNFEYVEVLGDKYRIIDVRYES